MPQVKLPVCFATIHGVGNAFGAIFNAREKAERYPGPRMYECADKGIVPYYPATELCSLIDKWTERLEGIESEGAKIELEAAIGDLRDYLVSGCPEIESNGS